MRSCLSLLAAILSFVLCQKSPPVPPLLRSRLFKQQLLDAAQDKGAEEEYPWVVKSTFKQKLDHFDDWSNETWEQRYYYNPKFSRNNNIVFLHIGGEGPLGVAWMAKPGIQYLLWAEEVGAHVFGLEHRFFGESWPLPNMNLHSLLYLTTQQALADIANFIVSMNKVHQFKNPRWVLFGGSYPGSLAAWMRSKYSNLTVGAVASSAPLELKLDFYEYGMVVEAALAKTNRECPLQVRKAFQEMQLLSMTIEGRNKLNDYFNLVPPFDRKTTKLNITNFFANVYDVFQSMTQYSYDGRSEKTKHDLTVAKVCEIMMNEKENVVSRVYNLYRWYNKITGDPASDHTVFPNSYSDMIASVNTGDLELLGAKASFRGWMWLSCNEMGFLQTTDQGDNIFGSIVPLNYYFDFCTDMFGSAVTMDHVFMGNVGAKSYYGNSQSYDGTNIVFTNGDLDPWHVLRCSAKSTDTRFMILMPGTAHCADMYPAYEGEPRPLVEVRKVIKKHVKDFIKYDPDVDGPGKNSPSISLASSFLILLLSQV